MGKKHNFSNAQQTFRQFAWNLAGTLASARSAGKAGTKPAGKR